MQDQWNQPPPKSQWIISSNWFLLFGAFLILRFRTFRACWTFITSQSSSFSRATGLESERELPCLSVELEHLHGKIMTLLCFCLLTIPKKTTHTKKEKTEVTISFAFVSALSGFLLGNLPEEHLSHLNMGTITKGDVLHILRHLHTACVLSFLFFFFLTTARPGAFSHNGKISQSFGFF